jgi:CBS domain-containing protein
LKHENRYNGDTTQKVSDLMSTFVDTVTPSMKVTDAAKIMRQTNVGSVPVVDRQRLVGILTDRDITIRATADGVNPDEILVEEVMTLNPVTVNPDNSVEEAAELMQANQIRRLPVVEGDRLVGILALGDMAVNMNTEQQAGEVLTEVSEPTENQFND